MAKHEDALIVIELSRWFDEMGLPEALKEVMADNFDVGDGSVESDAVRKVLRFGETIGSLVKHRVLDWDLISDLYWFEGWWKRVEKFALYERQETGEPRIYEHFEAIATRPIA